MPRKGKLVRTDELRAAERERYALDPSRQARKSATWHVKNRERILERMRSYRERSPEVGRRNMQNRRARQLDLFVETVDPIVLFDRDGGICHICDTQVEGEWAMDHVIPLAKGGPHCYANMAVSHYACNQKKHANLIESERMALALEAFETFHGRTLQHR